jgi:predicted outer membrane repeat protein
MKPKMFFSLKLAGFAFLMALCPAAWAQSSLVTNTNDSGAGSLRYVVSNATNNETITFAPALSGKTVLLTNGEVALSQNCTINASALPNGISLNGNQNSSIFEVENGASVMLNFLTLTNGYANSGGAVLVDANGSLSLNNCILQDNIAYGGYPGGGGAIYDNGTSLTLTNCTFANNSCNNFNSDGGGAINSQGGSETLMNCIFSSNNDAYVGGAICNDSGTSTLVNCTFSGNYGTYDGGAIISQSVLNLTNCTFTGNSADNGGAISDFGTFLNLASCTFAENSAKRGGGAIFTGAINNLVNCTFSGNSVANGNGGALLWDDAVGSLLNCTITGNSVTNGSGAGISVYQSPPSQYQGPTALALTNCIVAGNTPDNLNMPDDPNGSFTSLSNLTNGNPQLSPLGNYGGLTQTMLPLPGSPVLDAGNDAAVTGLATDQRGFPRISGAHVDLGAVEFQTAIVSNTADSGPGSLRAAATGYLDPGASITFVPNLSGQTIVLTSGQITLQGGPFFNPDGSIYDYGSLTLDASALPGGVAISGNHASGIFIIPIYGLISLKSLTLTNGNASYGGAIDVELGQLSLGNCSLAGNSASLGGAIYNNGGGVVVNESTLSGNAGPNNGGAIYNEQDGTMSLNECTLWGNSAASGTGGAIYNGVEANSGSYLYLNQCTVSGNSAANSSAGGIFNDDSDPDYTSLDNSIVSSNTPADFAGSYSGTPNLVGGNAKLAPLANYGGPTQTLPPLPGSPAIDACTSGTSFATDQRGYPRILGLRADLGAVEGIYVTNLPGKLTGMTRLGNGSTQFTFTNVSDASSTVLASTNLTLPLSAWPTAGYAIETPAGSGQFQFTDPQAANYPQRFYRVRSP